MHESGVYGVPVHLKPLVLSASRCGMTIEDVNDAIPVLLENLTASEMEVMCELPHSHF
jgi:hypothetical protein